METIIRQPLRRNEKSISAQMRLQSHDTTRLRSPIPSLSGISCKIIAEHMRMNSYPPRYVESKPGECQDGARSAVAEAGMDFEKSLELVALTGSETSQSFQLSLYQERFKV